MLCREGVTDMRTKVQVLEPRCSVEPRPRVLCIFIRLLALAPSFDAARGCEKGDLQTHSNLAT